MDAVNLGRQNYPAKKRSRHIPSVVQPDTLFHFVSKREYLMGMLKSKRIAPRYCCENFRYLNVRTVKELAFPMSCFCDIGLQKLEPHMNCYGSFGIALPKEWCMQKGFQAVQYLNHEGALASDTKTAIRTAMATLNRESSTKPEEVLTNYLLHQLMYLKPYQGRTRFRVDGRTHDKCFADECEWRYIPDLSATDLPAAVVNQWQIDNYLLSYSAALIKCEKALVEYEYNDLKYVMVDNADSFSFLLKEVENWRDEEQINTREMNVLLSKVVVWDEIKGDF